MRGANASHKVHLMLVIVLIGVLFSLSVEAQEPTAVYLLPIEGSIEPGLAEFVARTLQAAEKDNAAVMLEINTFGGRVDAATEIRDLIVRMKMPVVSYVTDRAWSAGALITLAAHHVAMAPGSSIGAAEPRPLEEKTVSALKAEFESTAQRAGRDPEIAGAMVDADVEIEGLVDKGKILSLAAEQALSEGFTDIVSSSRQEVLEHFGLADLPIVEYTPNWAERLARLVTEPTISSLLLTLGFLGLLYEITSLGWGVPGTVGIAALSLFFGGRLITGLAGLEVVILFVTGLVLLMLEVFVIPGFGVAGALGVVSMFAGIILSFGDINAALLSLLIALSASILFIILTWKRFTRSKVWRRLVLSHREDKELGYRGPKVYKPGLVGATGVTLTPLRPAGTALIDGERYDVVSEGGFLAIDTKVKVIEIEGTRIVVREITNN